MCSLFSVALHRMRTQVLMGNSKGSYRKQIESNRLNNREVPVDWLILTRHQIEGWLIRLNNVQSQGWELHGKLAERRIKLIELCLVI